MGARRLHFDRWSRTIQMLIFSAPVVCLAFALCAYHLKDLLEKRSIIQAEIKNLESSIRELTAVESQLKSFKQQLAQQEKQLGALKSLLPLQKESPAVLRSLQRMAASSNLKIKKFTPEPVIPREFYSDWTIQIEVEGNYDGLGLFFEKVGRATRIINVATISIKGLEKQADPNKTLTATCTATTFVFTDSMNHARQVERVGGSPIEYAGIRYISHNRRDPFLSPLQQPKNHDEEAARDLPPPGIAGTCIAELVFEGTSFRDDRRLAIVRGTDSRAYFLLEGDRLFDGYLKTIQPGSIILVHETKLRSGKILTQNVTKRLRHP